MTKVKKPVKKPIKTFDPAFVPKRPADVLARKNADGTIAIMRLDDDQYFFTLDGLAAEIWGLMDGKATAGQIQSKLIQKHNPPVARFEKDLSKLLVELKREKLISN